MLVKVFEALDDRKIQCIKVLRDATAMPLRQSKDVVDQLWKGRSPPGIEVYIRDDFTDDDYDAFGEWFDYGSSGGPTSKNPPKGTLKLFEVGITDELGPYSFIAVVLATSKQEAMQGAGDEIETAHHITLGPRTVTTCEEVTSFKNGQVLLASRV